LAPHHDVTVLPDRRWIALSERVRVVSIADYHQDAVLLVDVGGRLVVDLNDAQDCGWWSFVRKTIRGYESSFVLALSGWGDADMINFFHDNGDRIAPAAIARRRAGLPVGAEIASRVEALGATHFVPFSSMHRYQRSDSIWANECVTRLDDYAVGFDSRRAQLLPAFVRYDCTTDTYDMTHPPASQELVHDPKEFGDDWAEELDAEDEATATSYFRAIRTPSRGLRLHSPSGRRPGPSHSARWQALRSRRHLRSPASLIAHHYRPGDLR